MSSLKDADHASFNFAPLDRLSSNRDVFYRFKSSEPEALTMESEVSRLISNKESDLRDVQRKETEKNKVVQQIESTLGFARKQSREKTRAMEGELTESVVELFSFEIFADSQGLPLVFYRSLQMPNPPSRIF